MAAYGSRQLRGMDGTAAAWKKHRAIAGIDWALDALTLAVLSRADDKAWVMRHNSKMNTSMIWLASTAVHIFIEGFASNEPQQKSIIECHGTMTT